MPSNSVNFHRIRFLTPYEGNLRVYWNVSFSDFREYVSGRCAILGTGIEFKNNCVQSRTQFSKNQNDNKNTF